MLNKLIRRLVSVSAISTMVFSTGVQAADKPVDPKSATVIVGDLSLPFSSQNVVKAMAEASSRGYTGKDLDPIYITFGGGKSYYFNLKESWSNSPKDTLKDDVDYWKKVKYVSSDGGSSFTNYTGGVTLSTDKSIIAKSRYSSIVVITDTTITIPSGTTGLTLKAMIEPKTVIKKKNKQK